MWELDHKEGWGPKKWCFQIVELEKTLESPLTQEDQTNHSWRKSTLSIHWKDWCWSGSSNTLGTRCEEPTHWKRLMLGKIEGKGRKGWQKMRWLDSTTNSMNMNLSKLWEILEDRKPWCAAVHGVTKCWIRLSDWTDWTHTLKDWMA